MGVNQQKVYVPIFNAYMYILSILSGQKSSPSPQPPLGPVNVKLADSINELIDPLSIVLPLDQFLRNT